MRCLTPQVAWHNKEPVLSIDIDPSTLVFPIPATLTLASIVPAVPDVATDITDNAEASGENGAIECEKMEVDETNETPTVSAPKTELPVDSTPAEPSAPAEVKPTVVSSTSSQPSDFYRFATGGADMLLLVWHLRNPDSFKPELTCVAELNRHTRSVNVVRFSGDGKRIASADDDAYLCIWKYDGNTSDTDENWVLEKSLRKHFEDISDLSWSKCGNFLVSGSVDNSAVLWDIKKGEPLHFWSDHGGFVQGVAFDPMGEFAASVCTDRTLRLFNVKSGKVLSRALKYPSDWITHSSENMDTEDKENDDLEKTSKAQPFLQANRIFHDDTLRTFCRRPQFSPRGEVLLVPGALLPPNYDNENSPAKKKLKDHNHSSVIFCRNSFTNPCAVLPSGASYAIACRFCPVYFYRNREAVQYDPDLINSTKKSERTISCVGKLKTSQPEETVLMNMPYRMVFAIATNDSVIIGDTESAEPLAVVGNIHCTRLTDITWSSDGRVILVSSTDGFCSFITFEENELGRPYPMDNLPELLPNCFPVEPKPVPVKDSDGKKKALKEDPKSPSLVDTPKETKKPKEKKESAKKVGTKAANLNLQLQLGPAQDNAREATPPPKPNREIESVEEVITPTTEIRDSISKIKVTPQRNTLDRWLQKTPKSREQAELQEKKDAEAEAKLISKLEATLPISSEELAKLKQAPIIVDLDSDDDVKDLENGCLSTIPTLVDESRPKLDIAPLQDEDLPVLNAANSPQPGPSTKQADAKSTEQTDAEVEKRTGDADSPISSRPTKQPRRVQLITLASPKI